MLQKQKAEIRNLVSNGSCWKYNDRKMYLDGLIEGEQEDDYLLERDILLRNYQIKLFDQAKKQNSILYLPTGAGKTIIAVHVLCTKTNELKRPLSEGGKKAFFVATTKVMVDQMAKVVRTHTKFNVVHLTGDLNVDCWSSNKWKMLFDKNHVIVLTGEILKTALQLSYISPSQISLLVFDECHHAMNEHPYSLIMKFVNDDKSGEAPSILGLSSILINITPSIGQVEQNIRCLETTLNAKVITETQFQEVMSFAANPVDRQVFYDEDPNTPMTEKILAMYDNVIKELNDLIPGSTPKSPVIPKHGREFKNKNKIKYIRNCFVLSRTLFEELGAFGGHLSVLFYIIHLEKFRLMSVDANEIPVLLYANTELLKLRRAFADWVGEEESVASIARFSSNKVQELIHCLKEAQRAGGGDGKPLATLIFVKQRITAMVLAFLLKRLKEAGEEFAFLKPEFIVGSSIFSKESIFLGLKNEEIIKKFASRSLNTLVATNLLEEGIDVSACNVVISFDFPVGYPSYFQSRGRARNKESTYFIFIKRSEASKKLEKLKLFRCIENEVLRTVSREYRFIESEENAGDDGDKKYLQGENGTIILDGLMAIKVIRRYCSKLPQDKFSLLAPISWYVVAEGKKRAYLQLPMNCPLREIVAGELKDTVKAAKRSCFLRAVEMLYDMGELDQEMNPKSYEIKMEDFAYIFPCYKKEKIDKSLPQPGTRRREQKYKMKFAESLSDCLPRPGIKVYLHVINFTIIFDKPPLERKVVIYETLRYPGTFALLSTKKLWKIFQFPLFLDMGQINCDLLVNYDELVLTEHEINDIKECHFALFKKVTNVIKNAQAFDNRNKENSFFVVPMRKKEDQFVINWDLIRCDFCRNNTSALVRYKLSASQVRSSNECEKKARINQDGSEKFVMTETDYKYFVIAPNYRNQSDPQRYIVSKICRDLSPRSAFPKVIYEDYVSYYKHNYMVDITNMTQPLLKVSPIYDCTNFNKPRNRNLGRAKNKIYDEHLVPELCDVIPFDREYFLKALLLPTVLNRIYHIYSVEEFRKKIVEETGLGAYELPEGAKWPPFDMRHSMEDRESEDRGSSLNAKNKQPPTLPLAKLKDKTQLKEQTILDPERHMYEIGLCDVEFYVRNLKASEKVEEVNIEFQVNEEISKLRALRYTPVPPLSTLKGGSDSGGPDLAQLVQASTAKSANDIVDYERLEILGDSFLKFASTLYLFRNIAHNEGVLTSLKGKMVGNRNLLYCALAKGFPDIINVTDFMPTSNWNPPLISIPERFVDGIVSRNLDPAVLYRLTIPFEEQFSGVLSEVTFQKNEEILQGYDKCYEMGTNPLLRYKSLRDKTISDCVEAFIGAYLLALGMRGAFDFLMWLQVLPTPEGSYWKLLQSPYSDPSGPKNQMAVMNLLEQVFLSDLEDTLNYHFKDKALVLEAITHQSYFKNRVTQSYQRLELLGDAVLDFLITSYIYEYCGDLGPGAVTDIRSSLVNNITFACLTVRYELHKYMLFFSTALGNAINNFVTFQANRNHVIDDNVLVLLEENDYSIGETIQVPKALGDIFESLAAAIFLDSGNSLEVVWKVFYVLMKREIDEFTRTVPKTPARLLFEICGDKPYFESKVTENNMVMVSAVIYYENEEIRAYGFGLNKKEAKQSAAKVALNKILTLKK